MNAHELAKKLLDGPNDPIVLLVACSKDTVSSTDPENSKPIEEIEVTAQSRKEQFGGDRILLHVFIPDAEFGWDDN